ncbi:hypothetical protein [Polaromonas sp. UC242_47]|uniref:hypothetical protein n=1 Tax=Polaromonas sp. UC242_47 TaxID=3374626 RepID=UPI0037BBC3D1
MPIAVPEREFLFFSELEARWQMKADDLFNLILLGHVKPAIKLSQKLFRPMLNISSDLGVFRTGVVDKSDGSPYSSFYAGCLYLQLPKQTGHLDLDFELSSYLRDPVLSQMAFQLDSEVWFLLPAAMNFEAVKKQSYFLISEVVFCEKNLGIGNFTIETTPLGTKELSSLNNITAMLEKKIVESQKTKNDGGALVKAVKRGVASSLSMKVIRKNMGANERVPYYALIAELAKVSGVNLVDPGKDAGFIEGGSEGTDYKVSRRSVIDHFKRIALALEPRLK